MSRRLILIRHGQTTYNATGRMQGHLDTELSELGYEQARAAARLLQDQGVSKIVASDLLRARETARDREAPVGRMRRGGFGLGLCQSWAAHCGCLIGRGG